MYLLYALRANLGRNESHRSVNVVIIDAFFLAGEDLGERLDHSFPASSLFFSFFFKMEISLCILLLIPLLRPGSVHSGIVSPL